MYQFYKRLVTLRKSYPSLSRGSFEVLHTDDKNDLLIYQRKLGGEIILICINNSNESKSFAVPYPSSDQRHEWHHLLGEKSIRFANNSIIGVIAPKSGIVYRAIVRM